VKLVKTYSQDEVHTGWVTAYRKDSVQDAFNDRILDRILHIVNAPQDALVLDAGCGTGNHTKRLLRRGYRCVAVDISHTVQAQARTALEEAGLASNAIMATHALEELGFKDNVFDLIHCRGVLMHIPEWEQALVDLCRVLKPGGHMVILEANHRSIETAIVRVVRAIRTNRSEVRHTEGGLEFWSQQGGQPFVARVANISYLEGLLAENGVDVSKRFATEFWDLNRFPAGFFRAAAIRFNQAWFSLRLPASLSVDNAIVGVKQ
jgi:ubiquinone/menaquinone biosynthesis C-methylase UbiE